MFIVCIILFIIRFFAARMCVYNVFKYAQPDKALKYLVLSFIIPLAKAFLLRKCKNKICTDYESEKTECVSDELQNN